MQFHSSLTTYARRRIYKNSIYMSSRRKTQWKKRNEKCNFKIFMSILIIVSHILSTPNSFFFGRFVLMWRGGINYFPRLAHISKQKKSLRALFTKFLTPELTHELCNPLNDWLDWWIPTNHRTDYTIRGSTRELKVWWIRPLVFLVRE